LVKENAILQRKLVKLRNGGHENTFASAFGHIAVRWKMAKMVSLEAEVKSKSW
jgi:hypothetical protein